MGQCQGPAWAAEERGHRARLLRRQSADPLIACIERGFDTQSWLTSPSARGSKPAAHERKGEKRMTVVYADRSFPTASACAPPVKTALNNRSENTPPEILELVVIVY